MFLEQPLEVRIRNGVENRISFLYNDDIPKKKVTIN